MSSTTTQPTTPALTTWQLDPTHSQVEFAVRHLMISTVRGRFSDIKGTVTAPHGDFANAQIDVTIGVESIDTRDVNRDTHLRSADFFDAEKFPTITFKSRRVVADPGEPGKFIAAGDLSLHGTTGEVVLTVTAEGQGRDPWGNDRAGFSAVGKLSRKAFGLTWNQALEAGGVAVGDEIKIAIDAELTAKPADATA